MSVPTTVWVSYPGTQGSVELTVSKEGTCETCESDAPGLTDDITGIHACHPCFLKQIAMGAVRVVATED